MQAVFNTETVLHVNLFDVLELIYMSIVFITHNIHVHFIEYKS